MRGFQTNNANFGNRLVDNNTFSDSRLFPSATTGSFGTVTDTSLVLNYDFGNPLCYTSGSSVCYDLSGYGNDGTIFNSPTYSTLSGGFLTFNASTQYISLGTNGFSFGSAPSTIWLWTKLTDYTGGRIGFGYGSTSLRYFGTFSSRFLTTCNQTGDRTILQSFLAACSVYSNPTGSEYRNDQLIATNTGCGALSTAGAAANVARNVANSSEYYWGSIAELRVYNRALSSTEITALYNSTKVRYGYPE